MTIHEGTPWQPPEIDEYLASSFDRMEEQQNRSLLQRMDYMISRLREMEEELEEILETAPAGSR